MSLKPWTPAQERRANRDLRAVLAALPTHPAAECRDKWGRPSRCPQCVCVCGLRANQCLVHVRVH